MYKPGEWVTNKEGHRMVIVRRNGDCVTCEWPENGKLQSDNFPISYFQEEEEFAKTVAEILVAHPPTDDCMAAPVHAVYTKFAAECEWDSTAQAAEYVTSLEARLLIGKQAKVSHVMKSVPPQFFWILRAAMTGPGA